MKGDIENEHKETERLKNIEKLIEEVKEKATAEKGRHEEEKKKLEAKIKKLESSAEKGDMYDIDNF